MLINITQIIDLTGKARDTVVRHTKHLPMEKRGRQIMYESTEALPAVFKIQRSEEAQTLEGERTRLASAQAEKTELEVEVIKGNLIPAEAVEEAWNNMISAFRSRTLSLPTKIAPLVLPLADLTEAENIIRDLVYEALTELSEYEPKDYRGTDDKKGRKAGRPAASANSQPVGGRKKKTVKGGKRGARAVEH